ncbi:protein kinase A, partial [Tilletiaria anomala UBC 951]
PQPRYGLDHFDVVDEVGTGTFGKVLLVKLKGASPAEPRSYFAVKVLRKQDVIRSRQVEHTLSEKDVLAHVSHPFLVNLYSSFQDGLNCYMLMEFVPGGEIFAHLRQAKRFTADAARFYVCNIVLALEHLHARDIAYRDLKPENLLLRADGYVKLADFGFAKQVVDRAWTLCGTPEYLAPEIIQSSGHGKAVDYWSLGVLLFEMLAGYPPFYAGSPLEVYEKILQGISGVLFPPCIDAQAAHLIRGLLQPTLSQRLGNLAGGIEDIKRHPWFAGVRWDAVE